MKTFLLLAVGLPLLMPPGMCICQFVPCGESTGSGLGGRAELERTRTSTGCSCAPRRGGTQAAAGGIPACRDSGTTPGGQKSCPFPAKPWPDCPVVTGTAPDKFPTPAPVLFTLDLASVVVWSVEVPATPVGRVDHISLRPASSPLFISHCSLVI